MSAAVEIIETSTKNDVSGARRKIARRRGAARLVQISPSQVPAALPSRESADRDLADRESADRESADRESAVREAHRRGEAAAFPAGLLGGLRDIALVLQLPGVEGRVRVLTSREALEEARDGSSIVFDEGEWAALVTGAESDRVWPRDVAAFCARKVADPRWTLDLDTALGGARAEAPRGWTVGRVLERLGAQLVAAS